MPGAPERVPLHYLRPVPPPADVSQLEQQDRRREVIDAFQNADRLVFVIGGSSSGRDADVGALGETVLLSGFFKATLASLRAIGKTVPITLIVDETARDLYREEDINRRFAGYYDGKITVATTTPRTSAQQLRDEIANASGQHIFAFDFHGERSGAQHGVPILEREAVGDKEVTTVSTILTDLFQTAVWEYAGWYPGSGAIPEDVRRRYAEFLGAITGIPGDKIHTEEAQPFVTLPADSESRYAALAREYGLNSANLQIGLVVQSANVTKEYGLEKWGEVLALLSDEIQQRFPGGKADLTIFAGPDDPQKAAVVPDYFFQEPYIARADIEAAFANLPDNLIPHLSQRSIADVGILMNHMALNLGVDAGPMHISGALNRPTVVLFLPGQRYPARVWSSSLSHTTVPTEPRTNADYQQRRYGLSALEAGRDVRELINSIPPQSVVDTVMEVLDATKDSRPGLLPRWFHRR